MEQTVSIVIPVHNHWELTHQVLSDVHRHCVGVDEVLVVNDNADEPEVYKGLEFWKKLNVIPLKVVSLSENRGFLKASNIGIERAYGDVVILLSNDVRIYNSNLMDRAKILPDRVLLGGVQYNIDTGWNNFGGKIIPYMEGWLLAMTKKSWEELGMFDDRYAPNDFEDVDLSMKAIQQGYTFNMLPNFSAKHTGGQSIRYSEDRLALTNINRAKFAEKWGLEMRSFI